MIRIARSDDIETVKDLDREIFTDSPRLTDEELEKSVWWLAYDGGHAVGFAGVWPNINQDRAFLTRAGVLPEARGGGMQKKLIRVRVAYAKKLGIRRCYTYVWVGNYASMKSLVRCGFHPYYHSRDCDASRLYFENARRL
jgi:GNAT superfamily N-acetyltransferase